MEDSRVQFAGFWQRFLALFIDGIILNILVNAFYLFPIYFFMIKTLGSDFTTNSLYLTIWVGGSLLGSFVFQWAYFSLFEATPLRGTPGKIAVGIYIVDENGFRLSFSKASSRNLSKILSILFLGIGFFIAGITARKQALHDKIVGAYHKKSIPALYSVIRLSEVLYSGFWRRAISYMIDGLVLLVLITGLAMLPSFMDVSFTSIQDPGLSSKLQDKLVFEESIIGSFVSFSFIVIWLYHAFMESSPLMGTLGKMSMGSIVTDLDGNRISFGRATGRHFSKLFSILLLFAGYFAIAFSDHKQGIHDKIASTLVVQKH